MLYIQIIVFYSLDSENTELLVLNFRVKGLSPQLLQKRVSPSPFLIAKTYNTHTLRDQTYFLSRKWQENAALEMHQYQPLVTVKCSPTLQLFLCSVYTPVCVSGRSLPPCKALCEEAKAGCEILMNQFGIEWPSQLECDSFTNEYCEHVSITVLNAYPE